MQSDGGAIEPRASFQCSPTAAAKLPLVLQLPSASPAADRHRNWPNLGRAARTRFRSLARQGEISRPGGLPATSWVDQPPAPVPAPPARAANGSGSSSPRAAHRGPATSARRSPPPEGRPPATARHPSVRNAGRRPGRCNGCNRRRRAARCQDPATAAGAVDTAGDASNSSGAAPDLETCWCTPAASQ